MADIFISYASEDRERAKSLAVALEQHGWSVWWDRTIPPGKSFDDVIDEALGKAKCVVVLWSKDSITSTWVKAEAAEAARRRILVPAFIENVVAPLEFRRMQAANLTDWDGSSPHAELASLFGSVNNHVFSKEFDTTSKTVATLYSVATQRMPTKVVTEYLGKHFVLVTLFAVSVGLNIFLAWTLARQPGPGSDIEWPTLVEPIRQVADQTNFTSNYATEHPGIVARIERFTHTDGMITLELLVRNTRSERAEFCTFSGIYDTHYDNNVYLLDERTGNRIQVNDAGGHIWCDRPRTLEPGNVRLTWTKFLVDGPVPGKLTLVMRGLFSQPIEGLTPIER